MMRSGIGGWAPISILLRLGVVLGTDRIAKVSRLWRGATRLALPLATFRTLTLTSAATSSPTPSAARLAVLAAILRGLRLSGLPRLSRFPGLSGLPRFSGGGLALGLVLIIHIASFGIAGCGLNRLELRLARAGAFAAPAPRAASRLIDFGLRWSSGCR